MLANYFPTSATTRKVNTPLRTYSQFDTEKSNDIPADASELKILEQEYKSSYLHIYGEYQHVAVASLPDLTCALG